MAKAPPFPDGPSFTLQPTTAADNEMEVATLLCVVDSNPKAEYYWTKGDSNEVTTFANETTLFRRQHHQLMPFSFSFSQFPRSKI